MLKNKTFLSLLSGVLLSLSWPTYGFPYIIFFAFVPLFFIEEKLVREAKKPLWGIFKYSYLSLFIWNFITTWWIWNSTEFGAVVAIVLNSFFMSLVWVLFSFSKKYFKNTSQAIFILPVYWITFEYFHLDWDLSWSWLNLGNVFASHSYAVQWYEYTGTFGGAWWIFIVNILFFKLIHKLLFDGRGIKKNLHSAWPVVLSIVLPLGFSLYLYSHYQEKGEAVEVVVVQPNMDPWNEQFNSPPQEVIQRIIDLSQPLISENTRFLVAPESAIQEGLREAELFKKVRRIEPSVSIKMLCDFLKAYPHLQLVIGASTYEFLDTPTETSRTTPNGAVYDEYNTAILMNAKEVEATYHKSKLVPGPEKMPFKKVLQPLQDVAFDLGGTVGSLGYDTVCKTFPAIDKDISIAPLICYESIYGDFVAEFIRNRASLIFIITNDGWWGHTQGYKQHLAFAQLRAIECRRSIARSANTGVSAFVNQRGDMVESTEYWVQAALKAELKANKELTFFVRYGDYPARVSAFLAALIFLISISIKLKRKEA